jgi:hypothetical protein
MSSDNLDLTAVQRDAALVDALSQRVRLDGADHGVDPVAGLLVALVDDVDDGLLVDVADRPVAPPRIPEQSRRRAADHASVRTLPVAAPVGRRHVVRAVAALVVTAAMLSVSGVSAAVTGDPLRPYKVVFDVVRGHGNAVQKGLVVPSPKARPARTNGATAKAVGAVETARQNVTPRSSRGAWRPAGTHRSRSRSAWQDQPGNRQDRDRGSWDRRDDSRGWAGYGDRPGDRTGWNSGGTGGDLAGHQQGPGEHRR